MKITTRKITTRMARRIVALVMLITLLVAGITLILSALRQNIVFFLVPSDIVAAHITDTTSAASEHTDKNARKKYIGRRVRIGGLVVEGSLEQDKDSGEVQFIISDGKAQVSVRYLGLLPDLFREGQGIVAIGEIIPPPTSATTSPTKSHGELVEFRAEQVLAKHDEYYMPRGLEKELKKKNLWQGNP